MKNGPIHSRHITETIEENSKKNKEGFRKVPPHFFSNSQKTFYILRTFEAPELSKETSFGSPL